MEGLSQDSEFNKALCVTLDIGPHVQNSGDALPAGPGHNERRALHIYAHAEYQKRNRHECASIAAGHGGMSLASLYALDRTPHGGPASAPHRISGLFV